MYEKLKSVDQGMHNYDRFSINKHIIEYNVV
jgi:hypothetical protein